MDSNNKEKEKDLVNIRELAIDIINAVIDKGAYTNLALDKAMKKYEIKQLDKNFLTETVNGTVRMLKNIDWVLSSFLNKTNKQQNKFFLNILRVSAYQILFMEKVPNYAVVNDAVMICKKRVNLQLSKVCNAVLRNIIRSKDEIEYPSKDAPIKHLSVKYSHEEWYVKKIIENYGEDQSIEILKYNNLRSGISLRTNYLKTTRPELMDILEGEGYSCTAYESVPWAIKIASLNQSIELSQAFQDGYFYIQNPSSMLAAPILQASGKVYDLCCGLGGKTTHIAEMMNNEGEIFAYDIHKHKLKLLGHNCQRLGVSNVEAFKANIISYDFPEGLDYILLDSPCSGSGVLNIRADARWNKNLDDLRDLSIVQEKLLSKASQILNENGVLLYATCSILKEENEDIINNFLNNNKDFQLESFNKQLDFFPLSNEDIINSKNGMLTILPGKYDTDGMFYALLRRK